MNGKKIQTESAIWDLHIHTCNCPKGSNEFSKLKVSEYVEKIIRVFKSNQRLELFSFTDHNQISIDVYESYIRNQGPVDFLVGVEQDVFFDDNDKDYKHLIIYFDINRDTFSTHKDFINDYNQMINKSPIKADKLLDYIIGKKIRFALSPHAFKQGRRGIDYKWSDEQTSDSEAKKYIDQFFVFWEYGGISSRARAIEFLKDFELEEKISVISFSDSNNFHTLEEYLKSPAQEFLSLPTFKGLSLVGTDSSRIVSTRKESPMAKAGNLIGYFDFENNHIQLSDRLNCIIGGRGSGKSILLDSLALALSDNIDIKDASREKYIREFDTAVYNYKHEKITRNNFHFDYYPQSYVKDIFDSSNYYERIEKEFETEFNQIPKFRREEIKQGNKERFNEMPIPFNTVASLENITGFIEKYQMIQDDSIELPLLKKDIDKTKTIQYIQSTKFKDTLGKIIPKELQNDSDIHKAMFSLAELIIEKTYAYNLEVKLRSLFKNILIENYLKYKNSINDTRKDKSQIEEQFKETIAINTSLFIKRVAIINKYINVSKGFKNHYEECSYRDGVMPRAYQFKRVLDIEHPFAYLSRMFDDYFFSEVTKNSDDPIMAGILYYCFENDKKIKNKKTIEDLDNALEEFDLLYNDSVQLLYLKDDEYQDVKTLSPGTQTNILMEYLVHKETSTPLLIDQPEDNVDNQTIYNDLRKWFSNLKIQRQVIVVTHDANITINSDSENVIIAHQLSGNSFNYSFGALEYGENLETASNILDGGKEAVKRRLMKYGE